MGYCFDIELPKKIRSPDKKSSTIKQQSGVDQAKIVTEKLGIIVMKEDIMSRCNVCNYPGFVTISGEQMIELIMNVQSGRFENARSEFIDDWSIVFKQSRTDSNGKIKPGHLGKFLENLMIKRGVMLVDDDSKRVYKKNKPLTVSKGLDLISSEDDDSDGECGAPITSSYEKA